MNHKGQQSTVIADLEPLVKLPQATNTVKEYAEENSEKIKQEARHRAQNNNTLVLAEFNTDSHG